jgi:hypothetical protein
MWNRYRRKRRKVSPHAKANVFGRYYNTAGSGQETSRPQPQCRDSDCFLKKMTMISDAGFAVPQVGFSAKSVMRRDERHARAEQGVVMNVHIIGKAELGDQVVDGCRIIGEVVDFDTVSPVRATLRQPNLRARRHRSFSSPYP